MKVKRGGGSKREVLVGLGEKRWGIAQKFKNQIICKEI